MTAVKFELDEARARELIAVLAEEDWEQEVDELQLSDINDNWARAVNELLYLILDGGDHGEGALRGPEDAQITAYPLDFEDSSDVLIVVRMRGAVGVPQVAYPYGIEVRKLAAVFDTRCPQLFIDLCNGAVRMANELLPHLLSMVELHTQLKHDEEE